MRSACATLEVVAKMIQIRDVRPELHAELVRRAKLRGTTLTAYVEEILEREVARPPAEEVFDRIEAREPVLLGQPDRGADPREREELGDASGNAVADAAALRSTSPQVPGLSPTATTHQGGDLHVPEVCDVEVVSALRRSVLNGYLSATAMRLLLADYADASPRAGIGI